MGKCKQINNWYRMCDIILLIIIHERNWAILTMLCFLP